MKIIGKADTGSYDPDYICTVKRSELEKYLGLYYSATNAKLPELKVGDTVDLGRAHDYAREIASAMKTTQEFIGANQKIVTAILNGLHYQRIADVAAAERVSVAAEAVPASKAS
jgi:hypothetical protein